jgi:hypothetical protein
MQPPLSPRTLTSALRTTIYGAIAGCFALSGPEAIALLDAVVVGAVLADYTTWVMRTVAQLPRDLLHGCYDGAVNLLFGWFLFRMTGFDWSVEGESVAVAFLAYLLVAGIKITVYGLRVFEKSLKDDE